MWTWRTAGLLTALVLLAMGAGFWSGGWWGLVLYSGLAVSISVAAYWSADRALLRFQGARLLREWEAPGLFATVRELARRARIPMPRLYLVRSSLPNAFAVGGRSARSDLAVTQGLLEALTPAELTGVLAHEIAHLRHRDPLLNVVASGAAGAAAWAGQVGQWTLLLALLLGPADPGRPLNPGPVVYHMAVAFGVPLLALVLRLALARDREDAADRGTVALTGDPLYLARALIRIEAAARRPWWRWWLPLPPARTGDESGSTWRELWRSHPTTARRVQRLMDGQGPGPDQGYSGGYADGDGYGDRYAAGGHHRWYVTIRSYPSPR